MYSLKIFSRQKFFEEPHVSPLTIRPHKPNSTTDKCRPLATGAEALCTLIYTYTVPLVPQFVVRYPEIYDPVATNAENHIDNGTALPPSQDAYSPHSVKTIGNNSASILASEAPPSIPIIHRA